MRFEKEARRLALVLLPRLSSNYSAMIIQSQEGIIESKKDSKKQSKKDSQERTRVRIKLRAYDHKLLDNSTRQIIDILMRYGVEVIGPVPLPTEITKFTVNRSTFVHKNAREQFEMRVHKRLIDILDPTAEVIEALKDLSLPSGVDISIKI